jgi:hypothetical protein
MPDPPPSSEDPIAALVAETLEAIDRQGLPALDAACRAHPEHAEELRRRLGSLAAVGLAGSDDGAGAVPERLGEFRLLERLGGGGMGVVYLAEQETLGRTVALTLVRPERLYFEGARERFRREVEVIARLQHPGIVPIYAFGEHGGLPYFAMECVRGATLAQALERLAGRRPEDLTGADLRAAVCACVPAGDRQHGTSTAGDLFAGRWVEVCLRIARAVALALQHAQNAASCTAT